MDKKRLLELAGMPYVRQIDEGWSTETKEAMKDITKSINYAYSKLRDDIRDEEPEDAHDHAHDLVDRMVTDALRELEEKR